MIKLTTERFSGQWTTLPSELLSRLDRMFGRVYDRSETIPFTVREFVDATSGAVSRYLPDGNTQGDKDYQYIKTDNSVNAVTIYPFGTQLVDATTSYALAAQGDCVWLAFDRASQTWWPIAV